MSKPRNKKSGKLCPEIEAKVDRLLKEYFDSLVDASADTSDYVKLIESWKP